MRRNDFNIQEVKEYILNSPEDSKVYFGSDSEKFKRDGVWYARFSTVVVIHISGKKGCKVFGKIDEDKDIDGNHSKPFNRMLSEVYRVAELFEELFEVLGERDFEIHLDINQKKEHASNIAMGAAMGIIQGQYGIEPKFKPNAFAASVAADRMCNY